MPSLIQITSSDATNTLPVVGWGLLGIKHTACVWIWDRKDYLQDFGNGGGREDLKSLPEDMFLTV